MKYVSCLFLCVLFLGCTLGLKTPDAFSNSTTTEIGKKAVAVVKAEDTSKQVDQMAEANKKVEAARQQMEIKYAAAKAEIQKSYDDLKKKDDENFAKIGELNYGVYMVTQEKKKQDMNTLVAHLRAKEIMNRTDKLPDAQKAAIIAEINKEKILTIDQLYTKYNGAVELAVVEKQALDNAQNVIDQQEKEKAALRDAQRVTINKLQAERNAELTQIKKEAADQLALAKAAQKAEMVALIFKALLGVGILFLVLAIILKSISIGIGAILSLALAYVAATVEMWVVGASLGGIILLAIAFEMLKAKKKQTKTDSGANLHQPRST